MVALLKLQSSMERRSESFFQTYGITGAQFNILNLLESKGGKMEQAELVSALLVGKSSISIVLNRVVREGLIKRSEHPTDRRQVVLVLTAKGRKLWTQVNPIYQKRVEEVFALVSATRRKQLVTDLTTLQEALDKLE